MSRFLTFHHHGQAGNETRMAPSAYYVDKVCDKVSVVIYAEDAPLRDAEFDIYDDGVSIFNDRSRDHVNVTTGVRTSADSLTTAVLGEGENSNEQAGDFTDSTILNGSWIHCNIIDGGGGKNFTVILEITEV